MHDQAPAPSTHHYRGDIDGLRAISILAVIGFHAGLGGFEGGYVGVDVFFVISGFLITGLLFREASESGTIALGRFYSRRIRRLLPLAATVLTSTVLIGSLLNPPLTRVRLVDDAISASLYMSNWRSSRLATAYSDTRVEDELLVHFWSLSIEEQFYLVWPFLILAVVAVCRRVPRLNLRASLGVVLFAVTVTSFLLSRSLTASRGPAAYYLTHARIWEMAVGAGLAILAPVLPVIGRRLGGWLAASGLVTIALAVVFYDSDTAFPGTAALAPVLGCAAIIAGGLHTPGAIARWLGAAPMRFIGRLSYAWYLWHWPAIGLAVLWSRRSGRDFPESLAVFVAIVFSFALAWITHLTIENPLRQLASLRGNVNRNLSLGIGLMALPLVVGFALLSITDSGDQPVAAPEIGVVPDSMTPLQASLDRNRAGTSCDEAAHGAAAPRLCEVGNPNADFRVVLLGDSHAEQWIPAFDSIATTEDWSVLVSTRSSCSIIDVEIWSTIIRRRDDNCADWRAQVKQRVAELDQVDLIVMGRAAFYADRVLDPSGTVLQGELLHQEWQAGAARTFGDYAALADRVVFLADIPWPDGNPPRCLSSDRLEPQKCAFTRSGSIRDLEFLQSVRPEADIAGVDIIDTPSLVCQTPVCPVVAANGHIMYRDTHHLTATFVRDLSPQLLTELNVTG